MTRLAVGALAVALLLSGASSAKPPTLAASALPAFPLFGWAPYGGYQTYVATWQTLSEYDRYQVYVDGKPGSIQLPTAGPTQGFSIPLPCDGLRHRVNVRGGVSFGGTVQWGPFHKDATGHDAPIYFVTPAPGSCGS